MLLLDREFFHSQDKDNSLQHQLAWCLAFITGARPGSLAQMANHEDTMRWADWEILRDVGGSLLTAKVTFRCWKGKADEKKTAYLPRLRT
jgi:hypothetical protein